MTQKTTCRTDVLPEKKVVGRECRHVLYTKANDDSGDDLLVIKELLHYEDGTTAPNLAFLKNYKRPFWVTKEGFQNHKDKKEWEDLPKLKKFECTQAQLQNTVAKALRSIPNGMRRLARSQYLYGTDVSPQTIVKNRYLKEFPDYATPSSVAVIDIESDMERGTESLPTFGEIISCSLTFKDRALLCVTNRYLQGYPNAEKAIREAFTRYLGKYEKERNIRLEIEIVETPGEVVQTIFRYAHQWQPDFVAFWNIDFDMRMMLYALEDEGIDPAEVLCDPRVPQRFRKAKYIQGPAKREMASGHTLSLTPAQRWHTVDTPASFYFIDAMCVYQAIRVQKGQENSYALDYILEKNLGIRKLEFAEADHIPGHTAEWHVFMQTQYKIEYLIYNLFDCISVELLDEKNRDVAFVLPVLSKHSDYTSFRSNPKRLADDLHFFCQSRGKVIAATSDQMADDLDKYVISGKDWIITLPAYMLKGNSLQVLDVFKEIFSYIYAWVADLDISSSYPNGEVILNVSKETTLHELSSIEGIDESIQRRVGINLTGGRTNSVEICCDVLGFPLLTDLLDAFEQKLNQR